MIRLAKNTVVLLGFWRKQKIKNENVPEFGTFFIDDFEILV